jgi:hypothetical protein
VSGQLDPVVQLTLVESVRLDELEAVVDAGLRTFVEVGLALSEIRDSRLYRQTHDTFEAYCRERFGFSRQHGYRLIDAARVAELVSPMGDIPTERHVRELASLVKSHGTERAAELWRELTSGVRHPTAADVRDGVRKLQGATPPAPTHPGLVDPRTGWLADLLDLRALLGDDPVELAKLDAQFWLHDAALHLYRSGKQMPPPDTYEWQPPRGRGAAKHARFRIESWARRTEIEVGGIDIELHKLGLIDEAGGISLDRARVDVDAARSRCTIGGELLADFDSDACVTAAIGFAWSVINGEDAYLA